MVKYHSDFERLETRVKERASHNRAVAIVLHHTPLPAACGHCNNPVLEVGRNKTQGSVHHIDGNPFNNVFDNLMLIHVGCHHFITHIGSKKPGTAAAVRAAMTGVPKSPEHRANLSRSVLNYFASKTTQDKDN